MRTSVIIASMLVHTTVAAPAATLRVVGQEFEFTDDTVLDVQIVLEHAAAVAGLEFSIVYPGELLAVLDPTAHVAGDFPALAVVNHDGDSDGLPTGSRRIEVALAAPAASGTPGATLLTVSFPLRCGDFASPWSAGRTVDIELVDAVAWGIASGGLPEPVALTVVDGRLVIGCTGIALHAAGFSALKVRFGGGP